MVTVKEVKLCDGHLRVRTNGSTIEMHEFMESHAWLMLKYKPGSWWFEFPLLAYKLVVILASELLGSGTLAATRKLLILLGLCAAGMLVLVILDKLFRGSTAATVGLTGADVSEIVGVL